MKKLIVMLLAVFLVSGILCGCDKNEGAKQKEEEKEKKEETKTDAVYNDGFEVTHYATITVKDYGVMKVALYGKDAPKTVANFVKLASAGEYDGLTFMRVVNDFMIQGGSKTGTMAPDYEYDTIYGEFKANGFDNNIAHLRGVISMARPDADMNGARNQFFIVHTTTHQKSLDGLYASFGRVVEGIEVVDKICADAKPLDSSGLLAKDKQPVIESVKIETLYKDSMPKAE